MDSLTFHMSVLYYYYENRTHGTQFKRKEKKVKKYTDKKEKNVSTKLLTPIITQTE